MNSRIAFCTVHYNVSLYFLFKRIERCKTRQATKTFSQTNYENHNESQGKKHHKKHNPIQQWSEDLRTRNGMVKWTEKGKIRSGMEPEMKRTTNGTINCAKKLDAIPDNEVFQRVENIEKDISTRKPTKIPNSPALDSVKAGTKKCYMKSTKKVQQDREWSMLQEPLQIAGTEMKQSNPQAMERRPIYKVYNTRRKATNNMTERGRKGIKGANKISEKMWVARCKRTASWILPNKLQVEMPQ